MIDISIFQSFLQQEHCGMFSDVISFCPTSLLVRVQVVHLISTLLCFQKLT